MAAVKNKPDSKNNNINNKSETDVDINLRRSKRLKALDRTNYDETLDIKKKKTNYFSVKEMNQCILSAQSHIYDIPRFFQEYKTTQKERNGKKLQTMN